MNHYNNVENFSYLLKTNLMFFNGEIDSTYYYGAPWGKGPDQNNHAIVSTNNLIKLTDKYRIFSFDGQSSYTNMNEQAIKQAEENFINIHNDINLYENQHNKLYNCFSTCIDPYARELYKLKDIVQDKLEIEYSSRTAQRSYIHFFCEKNTLDIFKNKLDNDSRVWYCIVTPENKIITNMPSKKIRVTDDYTIFTVDSIWREFEISPYKNINIILDKLYLCAIICQDFSTSYTADDILIEYFENYTI